MKRLHTAAVSLLLCLPAAPLLAQTTIGGGTCNSSTLSGPYAVSLTGRGVTGQFTTGNLTNVLEAVGTATFDGQSKVTVALTANTNTANGTPLNWTGTYSVQVNCFSTVTITSGGSATLNLTPYNTGSAIAGQGFLIAGNDATYAYSGSGNTQPTGCSTAMLSGVYAAIFGEGFYGQAAGTAGGAGALAELLDFDGQGNLTVNATLSANGIGGQTQSRSGVVYTGTYSVNSNCLGSATVTNATTGPGVANFSIYTTTTSAVTGFYVSLGSSQNPSLFIGTANAVYGQPTTPPATASHRPRFSTLPNLLAKWFAGTAHKGDRA